MAHLLHNFGAAQRPLTEGLVLVAAEEVPHRPCPDPAVFTDGQQQAVAADMY